MPTKRSINLVLIDENKVSPLKAVPAIILIALLAVLFSKYLVADRLIEMTRASNEANRIKTALEETSRSLEGFEGIEDTYAHMTYAGMTSEELGRVNRVSILELVSTILPRGESVRSWSVSGNMLSVDITGRTLEYLNQLARKIEESPIVDTCAIATAVKSNPRQLTSNNPLIRSLVEALENRRAEAESALEDFVLTAIIHIFEPEMSESIQARFTIYLVQPPETEEAPEDAEGEGEVQAGEAESGLPKKPMRAVHDAIVELEEVTAP